MVRLIPLVLLLTACERVGEDRSPDEATQSEAKALDDAAAMLAERDAQAVGSAPKAEE